MILGILTMLLPLSNAPLCIPDQSIHLSVQKTQCYDELGQRLRLFDLQEFALLSCFMWLRWGSEVLDLSRRMMNVSVLLFTG